MRPRRPVLAAAIATAMLLAACTSSGGASSGDSSSGGASSGGTDAPATSDRPTTGGSTPTPRPSPSGANVVSVGTVSELKLALLGAQPGQTIALADGTYVGQFDATAVGTAEAPIRLVGSRAAILTTASARGNSLHLTGAAYWRLEGFSLAAGQKALVLDATSHTVVDGLDIGGSGMEAVHLRTNSSDNTIINSVIHDAGLDQPEYGEGIYVGSAKSNWEEYTGGQPDASDRNEIRGNTIRDTTAEPLDIKEGTSGGLIVDNTLEGSAISGKNFADSFMDVKGTGYQVTGNAMSDPSPKVLDAIQTHVPVDGEGSGNTFSRNRFDGQIPGYVVNIDKGTNSVRCDNSGDGAKKGLTNVTCT